MELAFSLGVGDKGDSPKLSGLGISVRRGEAVLQAFSTHRGYGKERYGSWNLSIGTDSRLMYQVWHTPKGLQLFD